jgi:carbamoyltransferase
MAILGLSSFRHNSSAALLGGGNVTAAIEDAKLSRSNTRGLPESAIKFCFSKAGISWSDLDAIAVATTPLRAWFRRSLGAARNSPFSPIAAAYYEANELGELTRDLSNLRLLRHKKGGSVCEVLNLDHQLCHAANAFYASPFERALILTIDEDGDGRTGMLAIGEGTRIRVLETIPFPHSLAWVYSQITALLGFAPRKEEHKTQWLSLEGEPIFRHVFLKMLRNPRSLMPRLDASFLQYGVTGRFALSGLLCRQIGLPEDGTEFTEDQRRALASSVQEACTEIVVDLLRQTCQRHGIDQICLGGGLFQNVLLVSAVEKQFAPGQVFVPAAPGNSGGAVGAASLVWHQLMHRPRVEFEPSSYWGPGYTRHEVKDVLDNFKSRYSVSNTSERKLEVTLQLLQAGKIVGWFQGATEFGPRALGNRSLLASPWAPYVKENLNDYIKHREWFRPFAISVPEEDARRYFEFSGLCRSMNSLGWVRSTDDVVPRSFCLPGNRIRLHVVEHKSNPSFWNLLKRFGEIAPAPMLLNTSFNLAGEPLVARPHDAVRSYFCSGIDALVIENFVLSKTAVPQTALQMHAVS